MGHVTPHGGSKAKMADETNDRVPLDLERVHVKDAWEVSWWSKELLCTESEVRAAVNAVGINRRDVVAYLRRAGRKVA